jgi:hypothetical protein
MNSYQLANVLRALRLSPSTGDWKGEVLQKIDADLREQGFRLDEIAPTASRGEYGEIPFSTTPNVPYPDDYEADWGLRVKPTVGYL